MNQPRVLVTLLLTGLLGSSLGTAQEAEPMIDFLDFGSFGGGSNPQVNYNPFSPTKLITDYTFEPLMTTDSYSCEYHPWLATDYRWEGAEKLTFTIREGVTWNDGQPFSAEDVAYTFNLLKEQPAFDSSGVWNYLASVTSMGQQVVFNFKEPSSNAFNRLVNIKIIPKHVWESVEDPVLATNEGAVGTGPYTPSSFNGQQLILERNPDYWQAEKIRVDQLIFSKAEAGGQVEIFKLIQDAYDTNAMFVPNIDQVWISRNPEQNHYWYPPGGAISLGFNLTKAPFDDLEFRRAVAYAIDREEIITKAQFGYVTQASQTGLVLPGQADWLAPDIPDEGLLPYDPDQAAAILEAAGYTKNADGQLLDKAGQPVSFVFKVQNGYTDWIQAAQIIQTNLQALGMTVDVQTPSPETVDNDRYLGDFDLVFNVHGGSCSMYDNYYFHLDSSQSAPIGERSLLNFIRWDDPQTDQLIDQLRQVIDVEKQQEIVYQLQKIQYEKFPTIPLWYGANWFQYSTKKATGWPNAEDPYAKASDNLIVMTKLVPSESYSGE